MTSRPRSKESPVLEATHPTRSLPGTVEHAAWLSPTCLVLAASFGDEPQDLKVSLEQGEESSELVHRVHTRAAEAELNGRAGPRAALLLVAVPHPRDLLRSRATVVLSSGGEVLRLEKLGSVTTDVKAFVRRAIAPLEPEPRADALDFVVSAMALVAESERTDLSETLSGMRDALRERLPVSVVSQSKRHGIHVDRLMAVGERSFYLEGWMYHEDSPVSRLTAVSPEGARVELIDRLFRHPRPDVAEFFELPHARRQEKLGFVCFFETSVPSVRPDGWMLELEDELGFASELAAPTVLSETLEVRDAILNDPYIEKLPDHDLMQEHIHPAISRIQERLSADIEIDQVIQYGVAPEAPDVTIVVPLYLQLSHLEVQLAQFADDPEFAEADLIYVLDSPEQEEQLRNYAADLFPIYEVPFRVAVLEHNVGFAGACNVGASLARGRLLLLLNSDILPDRPGWLSALRDYYDATPNIGALGPKLLYEDDSIQHAGMYFYNLPGSSVWVDAHYFKGMHRSLPAANVARRVPILSGACLMIDRGLYEEFGGLSGVFVQGDYEDSDLCLKLSERGYENWYTSCAELYHLEGQSYLPDRRRPANRYNMWLHSHLWGDRIAEIMAADSQPQE
jgi:GT2 family glycosyltransferase